MPTKMYKVWMHGAIWLTAASFISKLLSAVYRVPFQNMVGDMGFYIFQQVYPIYGIAMTLALGGLPVVISKLIAESTGNEEAQRKIIKIVRKRLIQTSVLAFVLLFVLADWIALGMGDSHLAGIIRVVSFVFLLMPKLALLRGYFQGQREMRPTAISQTVEQFIRVAIILIGASIATKMGYALYRTGSIAMSGSIIGGIVAILILQYFYKRTYKIADVRVSKAEDRAVTKKFFLEGAAICIVSGMLILFQLEDSFQVVRGMIVHGFSADLARNWKGVYDRAQPILQLGLVLSTGFSLALIPMITAARVKQDIRGLKRSVLLAVKITLLVAGAETVGLIVIMRPLNQMLFQTAAGTIELQLFMPAVLLSSLIVMFASILQGFGKLYIPVISVLIGIVVKWLANQFLIPRLGIAGASIATCLGLLIILGCCYLALKQTLPFAFITKKTLAGLAAALLLMACIPLLWETFFPLTTRSGSALQAIGSSLIGGALFILFSLRYNVLNQRDFTALPFSTVLFRISKAVLKNKRN